jgi:hypothetical protein
MLAQELGVAPVDAFETLDRGFASVKRSVGRWGGEEGQAVLYQRRVYRVRAKSSEAAIGAKAQKAKGAACAAPSQF